MIVIMLFTISVYLWQNKYVVILPGIFNLISIWKWRINSMKKFGILQRIRFRDRMFIIYFIGGVIPFIFSSYYTNIQSRNTMLGLSQETQTEELMIMRDRIRESMDIVEKVSTKLFINNTIRDVATKRYKSNEEFEEECEKLKIIDDYIYDYEQDISDIIIYTNNSTVKINKYFGRIGETITSQEWYEPTCKRGGSSYWSFGLKRGMMEKRPQLTRVVKDEYGNIQYIIAIQLQFYNVRKFISERTVNTMFLYNNDDVLYTNFRINDDWDFLFEHLHNNSFMSYSGTLSRGITDYIVTYNKIYQMDTGRFFTLVSVLDCRKIMSQMDEENMVSFITMFTSIALSVFLITLFSSIYGKRMVMLSRQMHLVAVGDYDKVVPIDGNDEITDLYKELEKMIEENKELLRSVVEKQVQEEKLHSKQMEMEFKMLASQINPHFLYNTLETIRMKALVNKQREIAELVKMLAKLMRRNIQVSDKMVTLKSEIESIEYYLKIQSYRFGDRIKSEIEIDNDIDINAKVLPLIIQPFVENAFVHGLEGIEKDGRLSIYVEREPGVIKITIQDNGTGMDKFRLSELRGMLKSNTETSSKSHIGINNVNQRIKLQYGEIFGVVIYSKEGDGTRVVITMPYYWDKI